MNNLKDTLKKYISMSPQTFSYAMIGLSTGMLVFFISHKDDDESKVDKPKVDDELKADDESKSDEPKVDDESKADEPNVEDKSKSLPEEQYDLDKDVEPSRIGDLRIGDLRIGGSRSSRSSRASRACRALDKGKSKHGKNTNTRKKGNKKHK